ncbi:MAG: hypothetical protein V4724_13095 [Pseudomonadota bacterium]
MTYAAINFYDVAGLCGVAAYIGAYYNVQVRLQSQNGLTYLALNTLGPLLILVSLCDAFNLASFVAQSCWLAITLFGLIKRYKQRRANARTSMPPP